MFEHEAIYGIVTHIGNLNMPEEPPPIYFLKAGRRTMIENATTIQVIKYLTEEIAEEEAYNSAYSVQKERAEKLCKEAGEDYWESYKYMPDEFSRPPRMSVIQDNNKMIRRLLLKMRKEG